MAFSRALGRLVSSSTLPLPLRHATSPSVTLASRCFTTNVLRNYDEVEGDGCDLDFDSRSARSFAPRSFSDVFEPFSPTRSLSMKRMGEGPYFAGVRGGLQPGWDAKETKDALNLSIDMPGLGKEDVKVFVENNTLVIKGEGGKEGDDEESVRKCTGRIELPQKIFKIDQIKAEMKNGVLKVTLPKLKEDERIDVLHVKVE